MNFGGCSSWGSFLHVLDLGTTRQRNSPERGVSYVVDVVVDDDTINLRPRYQMYLPDESSNTCALATRQLALSVKKRALLLFSSFGSIVDLCVRSSLSEGT